METKKYTFAQKINLRSENKHEQILVDFVNCMGTFLIFYEILFDVIGKFRTFSLVIFLWAQTKYYDTTSYFLPC